MQVKRSKLFIALVFSALYFLGMICFLIILWIKGTYISEPLFSRLSPYLTIAGLFFFLIGIQQYWLARTRGVTGHWLRGFANWIVAFVALDIAFSQGSVWRRDIALLVFAALVVLVAIWSAWNSLRRLEE